MSPRARILALLPVEILQYIASNLLSKHDLKRLAQVHPGFVEIVRAALYRSFSFTESTFQGMVPPILTTISAHCLAYTRVLSIHGAPLNCDEFLELIAEHAQLHTLIISGEPLDASLLSRVALLPSVQRLEVHADAWTFQLWSTTGILVSPMLKKLTLDFCAHHPRTQQFNNHLINRLYPSQLDETILVTVIATYSDLKSNLKTSGNKSLEPWNSVTELINALVERHLWRVKVQFMIAGDYEDEDEAEQMDHLAKLFRSVFDVHRIYLTVQIGEESRRISVI
ncbi:hypothetical protein DL96DRAFT_1712496 [Flagelloscypha sp. PMI_526]|nr:hypothetical protein DL96DRAFT_1712496 [Flagelloscypha sp. PMI_526]